MFVFIDESGIHKMVDHSTIVLVYLKAVEIEAIEHRIIEIENGLNISSFHWANYGSRRGWQIRQQFIQQVSELNFTFKVGIFRNPIHLPQALDDIFIQLLIEKNISKIVIDGKQPKWYARRVKSALRSRGIPVKKLSMISDESSAGLRLADALAGLVRSHHDNPTPLSSKLYRLAENKITAQLVGGQVIR